MTQVRLVTGKSHPPGLKGIIQCHISIIIENTDLLIMMGFQWEYAVNKHTIESGLLSPCISRPDENGPCPLSLQEEW